jgi:hypothetical protein
MIVLALLLAKQPVAWVKGDPHHAGAEPGFDIKGGEDDNNHI